MATRVLHLPFVEGEAFQQIIAGASPAPGASFTDAADSRYQSLLVAVAFRLVTDANAANRFPNLQLLDADSFVLAQVGPTTAQTASTTIDYCGFLGAGAAAAPASNVFTFQLPPVYVTAAMTVKVNVVNVQATDQLSRLRLTYLRWPEAWPDSPQPEE